MTLFILAAGYLLPVEGDMGTILEGDTSGFGDLGTTIDPAGNTAVEMSYTQTGSSFSRDRMNDIINNLAGPIDVLGVDNTYILPDGNPVTSEAGSTTYPPDANGIVYVIYDVTDCGGSHYYVYDTAGHQIPFPPPVILFHELSHAYHEQFGDLDLGAPEVQAETDENGFRAEVGLALRNVNNHGGGCGGPAPTGTTGGSSGGECFIATAAYGSALAPPLIMLQDLRDRLVGQSQLGNTLYTKVRSEYYRFSPSVAADMSAEPALRRAIATVGVEPLLAFFLLVEEYIRIGWQDELFSERAEQSLDSFLNSWSQAGYEKAQIPLIALVLGAIRLDKEGLSLPIEGSMTGREETGLLSALDYLGRQVSVRLPSAEYLPWALLTPLQRYWSAVARKVSERPGEHGASRTLISDIKSWLSVFPIPSSVSYTDASALRRDLVQMARSIFTDPEIRHVVGSRLLEALVTQPSYDVQACLREVDYLTADT